MKNKYKSKVSEIIEETRIDEYWEEAANLKAYLFENDIPPSILVGLYADLLDCATSPD